FFTDKNTGHSIIALNPNLWYHKIMSESTVPGNRDMTMFEREFDANNSVISRWPIWARNVPVDSRVGGLVTQELMKEDSDDSGERNEADIRIRLLGDFQLGMDNYYERMGKDPVGAVGAQFEKLRLSITSGEHPWNNLDEHSLLNFLIQTRDAYRA